MNRSTGKVPARRAPPARRHLEWIAALAVLLGALVPAAPARDWPTERGDNHRSGVSPDALGPPLVERWTHQTLHPPRPAWPPPARQDYWHHAHGLSPTMIFDRAPHVTASRGVLLYGSSADDAVRCLEAATGTMRWTFTTEGPVRLAPTIAGGRVYVGSDDGLITCLDLEDGRSLWRRRIGPEDRRLPGNGRMISLWPVRSGVIVEDNIAYAAAGVFPQQGCFLAAMDAGSGEILWRRPIDVSVQGAMALSPRRLLLPTGRTPPAVFDRRDGTPLGSLGGATGSFAVVLDDVIVHGGGERPGIDLAEQQTNERIVSVPALRLVADGPMIYFLREGMLVALDRTRYLELSRQINVIAAIDAKQRTAEQRAELERLQAARRACQRWATSCQAPYELIAAADALIAGGRDEIVSYSRETGALVWRAPVRGRAYGLALSDGRLYVSTDEGAIHCFEHDRGAATRTAGRPESEPTGATRETLESAPRGPRNESERDGPSDEDLLGWWIVEDAPGTSVGAPSGRLADRTRRMGVPLPIGAVLDRNEDAPFLLLDGTAGISLATDAGEPALPREAMTVEAWVRVDQPQQWGGIAGYLQDNGSYERGWLLGYNETRFLFALKSQAAESLTYLQAEAPSAQRVWHHVAGSYDGQVMRLYVDGEAVAETRQQHGPIDYPPHAFFEIGAYHDDDELYGLRGALHEVRLLGRVLAPEAIRERFAVRASEFSPPLALSELPAVTLLDDGRARVAFTIDPAVRGDAGELELAYGVAPAAPSASAAVSRAGTHLEAVLGPLPARTLISYRIRAARDGAAPGRRAESALFHFDSGPQPFLQPRPYDPASAGTDWEAAAREILEIGGVDQGYCLLLGAGRGELAYELARRSHLRIIGVETDPRKRRAARDALQAIGLWGTRIVIHDVGPDSLPYPDLFANLIVDAASLESGGLPATPRAEIERLLRPCGGTLLLHATGPPAPLREWLGERPGAEIVPARAITGTWTIVRRGPLAGSGEWTQTYAEPGNSACSGDSLATGTMELQWFGRPGPRRMIDRHHRNVPPLYKDGRCFIPGDGIVYATDAYNGTILWQVEIPGSRRLGVFLDSSNLMVGDHFLYVAAGKTCHRFDVRTGKPATGYAVPARDDGAPRDWSYLGRSGGLVIGSACRPGAAYQETSYDADAALWYRGMKLVTSDGLFALDERSGQTVWHHRDSLILNTTLTLGTGRLYFVETTSPAARENPLGRMPLSTFFAGGEAFLVALDAGSGQVIYRRPIETARMQETVYLACKDGVLLLSGSRAQNGTVAYHLEARDARTGEPLWEEDHDSGLTDDGGHGEYNRHPTIVGHTVYAWPYAFDLMSGARDPDWRFDRRGHGCGGVSASAVSLFWRGGNPWMFDLGPTRGPQRLTAVTRPGCWINIIPAGGLVLLPEASSGCTCPFSVQCSLAMRPGVEPPRLEAAAPIFVHRTEVGLALQAPPPGAAIHYTLDSSLPDREAPVFEQPIPLEKTTHLRARTILADGRRSRIEEWTLEKVTPQPAASPGHIDPGLAYQVLSGSRISRLAGMAGWRVTAEGVAAAPDSEAQERPDGAGQTGRAPAVSLAGIPHPEDDFGVVWRGVLRVPADGIYTFSSRSDDGSSVAIDGAIVVDNDGLHGAASRAGRCALQAGWHAIEIRYFEAAGNNVMEVRWSGPGFAEQPLPVEAVGHTGGNGGRGGDATRGGSR